MGCHRGGVPWAEALLLRWSGCWIPCGPKGRTSPLKVSDLKMKGAECFWRLAKFFFFFFFERGSQRGVGLSFSDASKNTSRSKPLLADNLLKADLSQQAVRCQIPHCVLLEFHVDVKSSILCPVSDLYVSSWTPVEQCDMIDFPQRHKTAYSARPAQLTPRHALVFVFERAQRQEMSGLSAECLDPWWFSKLACTVRKTDYLHYLFC